MTLMLELTADEQRLLEERAAARGQAVAEYAHQLLHAGLMRTRSILESAKPFADAVAASGVSDDEFDDVVQRAIEEVRGERRRS